MAKTFEFKHGDYVFKEKLMSFKCADKNCKKIVQIGAPYCPAHTALHLNLKIKKSNIPNAGLGVFAHCPKMPKGYPVFRKGYRIYPYYGENISDEELHKRYNNCTGPYALGGECRYGWPSTVDAALVRSIMSLVNHSSRFENICYVGGRRSDGGVNCEAVKDIYHGDELYADYGCQYFDNENNSTHSTY